MVAAARVSRWAVALSCISLAGALLALAPAAILAAEAEPSASPDASAAPMASAPPTEPSGWTITALGGAQAIGAGPDRFVVVGNDGQFPGRAHAWTSTDGVTWDPASVTDAEEGTTMSAVVAGDQGFVALGTAMSEAATGPDRIVAWHSPDGLTWERAELERPGRGGLSAAVQDIAAGPAGLLALGQYFGQDAAQARIWRSADGLVWETAELPGQRGTIRSALVAIPDGYLLVGQRKGRPSTWTSADGVSWERVVGAPRLIDAASAPDGTVVGIGSHGIWTTSDLATWERVWQAPDPAAAAEEDALIWAAWDGSFFDVFGLDYEDCPEDSECSNAFLLRSADGATWSEVDGPDGQPGPDQASWFEGVASVGDVSVLLGLTGPGTTSAWLMPAVVDPSEG